ncbi:TPA: hypothetical protein L6B08_21170 [Pseudomonas aeruginosa]|uniref:Uncharacterized protein n=1 Tax=Pseudomonas aeruginosa TaxID=287 RepID=A0ABD7JZD4_PSEAI|nr:hypothetical protein B7D75_03730 [Pseudomonas paraeruginosa]KAB0736055.1 hypothetical protein F7O94_31085 [Pseudomonas aeruginosa]MCO3060084.1 hypothetical protein [Pseudomonas aeruginosa]MCO3130142.1 hypothetical protein [Pseudomonas aeruginosa]MCO3162472.1 hypothetical protein [Pseudomonas aeruginosa]
MICGSWRCREFAFGPLVRQVRRPGGRNKTLRQARQAARPPSLKPVQALSDTLPQLLTAMQAAKSRAI